MSATTEKPKKSHRALMVERQSRSLVWRVIHFLGSLKLALILLATIAIACAVATFFESSFDTKIAMAYIYKAPWFVLWLGVLCLNLFCVTVTRWPWKRKHLGFVITHYGIIMLLAGAVIGSKFGFEGNVTLHKGAKPLDRIITSRSILQVENPATGGYRVIPFDADLSRPSEQRPKEIAVPDSSLKILADGVSENLILSQTLVASTDGQPGVSVVFDTKMMGQHLEMPFILGPADAPASRDFFNMAQVSFLPELPQRAPLGIEETQIVFAKFQPIVEGRDGVKTGVAITLSADGTKISVHVPDGKTAEYVRAEIQNQPQELGSTKFTVVDYWPDFVIENGKPRSAGMLPNNPAILVRVTAPPQTKEKPSLELAPAPEGVAYQLCRGDKMVSRGVAKVGETFPLGWADWTATITQSLPRAALKSQRLPGPKGEAGMPGFHARLVASDGTRGTPQWIGSGETTTLTAGHESLHVGYGLELLKVPFTISLRSFEVPRVEGSDTPSNFIASVEFEDLKTGAKNEGVAQMNHPASWPGGFFAVTTGLNYKFSQAEWNPENLDQTTLQVLYDPGWLLKWLGSLAICVGIFIMFYLRPKKS